MHSKCNGQNRCYRNDSNQCSRLRSTGRQNRILPVLNLSLTCFLKSRLKWFISKVPVKTAVETAKKVLYTGNIGDGKIFVYDVENAIKGSYR